MIAELGSGVQPRHDGLQGCDILSRYSISRYAAPVIDNCGAIIRVNRYFNSVAAAGHGFVYAVIDYLIEKLVQPVFIGAANIHSWPQAHGLDFIQNLDIFGAILVIQVVRHHSLPASFSGSKNRKWSASWDQTSVQD
jgi:hypothetical protein